MFGLAPRTADRLRLRDDMMDLDAPIRVEREGNVLFEGSVTRSIAVLQTTFAERDDPALMYSAEVQVTL